MNSGHFLAASLLFASSLAAATYQITDLGTLGGSTSDAYGINASGQVVGRATTTGNTAYQATVFSGNGSNLGIPGFGGTIVAEARGINASGVVVGTNTLSDTTLYTRAFAYSGGLLVDLGTLGGNSSRAYAINDKGQVTGEAQITGNTQTHAFRYQNGTMTDLGGTNARGYAINSAGHVVGRSNFRAFIAIADSVTDIGTLGGANSTAYDINDNAQVVGESHVTNPAGAVHAFLYQNGTMQDIGVLANGRIARAYAINNSSQIVGTSNLAPGGAVFHAFLYQGGQMTDLNDLVPANSGWVLEAAHAINDNGQIAGSGTLNGQTRAFLLTKITPGGTQTNPPRVYINGSRHVVTAKPKHRIEGSSGGDVESIRYRVNGKGPWRKVKGRLSGWKVGVTLEPGPNVVQFIAYGAKGAKSKPAKIVIVRVEA